MLRPDWDMTDEINARYRKLEIEAKYVWVRGHQDDDNAEEELPVPARYNVIAEDLAEKRNEVSKGRKINQKTPMLPEARVYLFLDKRPVTGKYIAKVRERAMLPKFQMYMKEKHGWKTKTKMEVDWELLKAATKICQESEETICKLVSDQLPTRYRKEVRGAYTDSRCRYCGHEETFAHLLRCNNKHSKKFRETVMEKLTGYFEQTNLDRAHANDFHTALINAILGTEDSKLRVLKKEILTSQKRIGWDLFLRGFWTTKWRQLWNNESIINKGRAPIPSVIMGIIWEKQLEMWKAICNESHKKNENNNDSRRELEAHIRHLHTKKNEIQAADRKYLLLQDVDEYIQTATTTQMEAWLELHKGPIKESIKRAEKEMEKYPQLMSFGFSVETTERRKYRKKGQTRKHVRWKWEDKARGALWKYLDGN